ncbi:hypothetical protein PoB_007341700 [Plakobranchus ocellatus]|uniref:Uncharacterized protein n=1 Tax=Plakobranchus ocellatus TaxID=259542 RepID=A0AAV4DSA5_9GAST|nr:hypothetical protein PoB_007341700 [Plakobranchus ocellatus]
MFCTCDKQRNMYFKFGFTSTLTPGRVIGAWGCGDGHSGLLTLPPCVVVAAAGSGLSSAAGEGAKPGVSGPGGGYTDWFQSIAPDWPLTPGPKQQPFRH